MSTTESCFEWSDGTLMQGMWTCEIGDEHMPAPVREQAERLHAHLDKDDREGKCISRATEFITARGQVVELVRCGDAVAWRLV